MAHALTMDSERAAHELYQILRELDPSRWRADLTQTMAPRIQALRTHLQELTDKADAPALATIRERMAEVSHLLEHAPRSPDLQHAKQRWNDFRLKVSPAYERLAASLSTLDIHVPSLRPTNYARNFFHIGNAVVVGSLVHWMMDTRSALITALIGAGVAWSMEISRRVFPKVNTHLMRLFGPFAHPHEAWRVNSATWYATALCFLALLQDLRIATVAIIVLGFADPAAAVIGRRFGTIKLVHGRSLQGTGTFVVVGTVVAYLWLTLAHSFSPTTALAWALSAAIPGAVAELFSRRIDDNLSIPVSVAVGLLCIQAFVGA